MADRLTAPRFSVLVPVRNGARWLPGAIESVLGQTFGDWELVIGDNASDDDLASIASGYGDPRIRYQRFDEYADIFPNFDRTAALARGAWLYLLPVDDRLAPTCLDRISERIAAYDRPGRLAAVITAAARVDPDGRNDDVRYYGYEGSAVVSDGTYDAAGWLRRVCAPGSPPWDGGAFSRDVIEEMGTFYRTDIPDMSADLELALRIAAFGDVAYIDEPLIMVTGWPESHTHGRFGRNLSNGAAYTTQGAALAVGLRAHEARRVVSDEERAIVRSAIARSHLRRASAHRYRDGGRGRAAAWRDIRRAARLSPETVVPFRAPQVVGLLLAPRWLLVRTREFALERRRRAVEPGATRG